MLKVIIVSFLISQPSIADTSKTSDIVALRSVRTRCIETIDVADAHLRYGDSLLESDRELEAKSSNGLRETNQNVIDLAETEANLEQRQTKASAQFLTATATLDQAAASWQRASQMLPNGKDFESAGTKALTELAELAQTDGQTEETAKEIQELNQNFKNAVKKWRDANLSFEQAKVELNVRGCESQRKGIVDQLDNATRVLAKIKPAVTDIQGQMDSLRKDSARWVGSLTQLDDKLHAAGELLSECRHQFHLADLAFATRVLLQTCDEMAANSFEDVSPYNINLWDIVPEELPNVKFDSLESIKSRPENSQMMQTRLPTMKASDKRPANIAENMARLDLATAKLKYLAELLEADAKSLGSAVERLEKIGKEATKIEGKVAELFQNLASLGQALDRHRTDIAVGLGRLLLVQKRLESEDSALRASVAEATRQIAEFNRLLGN